MFRAETKRIEKIETFKTIEWKHKIFKKTFFLYIK